MVRTGMMRRKMRDADTPIPSDRPIPPIHPHGRSYLRAWEGLEPRVVATEWGDKDDPAVFAAVSAVQNYRGEPWLIRGVLRRGGAGRPPVLTRVAIEHLLDPSREVTGPVVREIPFAKIRNLALEHLPVRSLLLEVLVEEKSWH